MYTDCKQETDRWLSCTLRSSSCWRNQGIGKARRTVVAKREVEMSLIEFRLGDSHGLFALQYHHQERFSSGKDGSCPTNEYTIKHIPHRAYLPTFPHHRIRTLHHQLTTIARLLYDTCLTIPDSTNDTTNHTVSLPPRPDADKTSNDNEYIPTALHYPTDVPTE